MTTPALDALVALGRALVGAARRHAQKGKEAEQDGRWEDAFLCLGRAQGMLVASTMIERFVTSSVVDGPSVQ